MQQFSDLMMDHFMNPRNVGELDESSASVGTGTVTSDVCGDVTKLYIEIGDDERIVDAKFKTFGCGAAIASSSYATEWLKGKTLGEATQIDDAKIAKVLDLPPMKVHCSVLSQNAVASAIADWKRKSGKSTST